MRKVLLTAKFIMTALALFSQNPLTVTIQSSQSQVCPGAAVGLTAIAQGGNPANYIFYWSSEPSDPSLTSVSEPNVMVSPGTETVYTVHVNDGAEEAVDNETISMYMVPVVTLGGDTVLCVYDSLELDAGPASAYLWSNGCCQRFAKIGSTGLGYDTRTVWVEVENNDGCTGTDTITVFFGYAQCTGLDESKMTGSLSVYPNPSYGRFFLALDDPASRECELHVYSMDGRCVWSLSGVHAGTDRIYEIDLSGLEKGIYLVRLTGANAITYERRIVILD